MSDQQAPPEEAVKPAWEVYKDQAEEWRWRYVSPFSGDILADSGEGYKNEADCLDSMRSVQLAGAGELSAEVAESTAPLKMAVGRIGPELPDPLPSMGEAVLELRNATRGMRLSEEYLSHSPDEKIESFAVGYLDAQKRLRVAEAVVSEIVDPLPAVEPVE